MTEMTHKQVADMTTTEIAVHLRRAAAFQRENRAITWEHGYDIVSIVATHGDRLAEALDAVATLTPKD